MGLYRRQNTKHWWFAFRIRGRRVQQSARTSDRQEAQRVMERRRAELLGAGADEPSARKTSAPETAPPPQAQGTAVTPSARAEPHSDDGSPLAEADSVATAPDKELLATALEYAQNAIPVIPLYTPRDGSCDCPKGKDCTSPGKHPRIRNWPSAATTDLEQIRAWWAKWRNSNIGVTCRGFVVLDLDTPEAVTQFGHLRQGTRTARTRRGLHLYFRVEGRGIRSRKLADGVDLKGEGGFVVAPPSLAVGGTRYTWLDYTKKPAEAPPWVVGGNPNPQWSAERPTVQERIGHARSRCR